MPKEQIKITPGMDIQAPAVEFAPVTILPSAIGEFTKAIQPAIKTVGTMLAKSAEDDGKDVFQNVSKTYYGTLDKHEASETLTEQNINRAQQDAMRNLNNSLSTSGVAVKHWSGLRGALKDTFTQDNRFTTNETDTVIIKKNLNTGQTNIIRRNDEEIKAIKLGKFLEDMSPAKAVKFSKLSPEDQQTMIADEMKRSLSLESLSDELTQKTGEVD